VHLCQKVPVLGQENSDSEEKMHFFALNTQITIKITMEEAMCLAVMYVCSCGYIALNIESVSTGFYLVDSSFIEE
jgi:hypothetical protein